MNDDETLLDYVAVGRMTNLNGRALRALVKARQIPHLRLGPRTIRFERQAVARWLSVRRVLERSETGRFDQMTDAETDAEHLLDYAAVGRMANVSLGTLRWLVHERRLPHLRLGPRLVRFERRAVERWLAERQVTEQRPGP